MRIKKLCLLFVAVLISNISFCQSGWIIQSGNTSSSLTSVFFVNQSTGWISCWSNNILRTTNGGTNWIVVNSGYSCNFQHLFFTDIQTGWVVGNNGTILKTVNSGVNWAGQYSPVSSLLYYNHFVSSSIGWISGENGILLKTTNGGVNWVIKNTGTSYTLTSVFFVNENTGWIGGDQGTIKKSTNGGDNWVTQFSGALYNLDKMYFINAQTGWIPGYNGTILKTTNGGDYWTLQNSWTTSWLSGAYFIDQNTGWISGGVYPNVSSIILKTTNGGVNWFSQTSPTNNFIGAPFFANSLTGWIVGYNGAIVKTYSGGLDLPLPPVLIYPSNGATNIPLTPAMTWGTVSGATSYKIQISPVSNFSTITDSATLTTNQRQVPAGRLTTNSTYFWRVSATGPVGTSPWSDVWYFSTSSSGIIQVSSVIPPDYKLYSNYPNPFNPATKIKFDLPKKSHASLVVYDALGRAVQTLVNTELKEGTYEYTWDASKYNSGVYFIRIISDNFADTKKMMLVK